MNTIILLGLIYLAVLIAPNIKHKTKAKSKIRVPSYIGNSHDIDIRTYIKDPTSGDIREYRDGRAYSTSLTEM